MTLERRISGQVNQKTAGLPEHLEAFRKKRVNSSALAGRLSDTNCHESGVLKCFFLLGFHHVK